MTSKRAAKARQAIHACSMTIFGLVSVSVGSILPTAVCAQSVIVDGAISGQVTDQSGAALTGATIVARNIATGLEQTEETDNLGLYRFSVLMPGGYTVTAKISGFQSAQASLQVLVGNTATQDLQLRVGNRAQTVFVKGTLLRSAETSQSYLLDRPAIDGMPLNGRRYTDFSVLSPNTSADGDTGLVSIAGQQGGEDAGYANGNGMVVFSVDGSNATSNYFADMSGRHRIPYLYGENAIEEFQVAESPYSAIYGGGAGFINAVTRSGGNTLHGNLFYYNRDSEFRANDSLSKAAGYARQPDALQQFGGSLGGPIKKNRLWFFADYEQQRENAPISIINSTLQASQPGFLSSNFGIADGTSLPAPNGPYPLPGSDTVNDPNLANDPQYLQQVSNVIGALNSNLGVRSRQKNDIVVTPRIDYQATSRDNLFVSMNLNRFDSPGGVITVSPVSNYGIQTLANAKVHEFQSSLGWTHTFSPSLLNEFHAGASDDNQIATPTGTAGNTPTIILDSPSSFVLGNAPFSVGRVFERQYSAADRLNITRGRHTVQVGFDFNRAWDSDNNFGGADPNADVQSGSFLGSYDFANLQNFALGQYTAFNQSAGNPTFSFGVPYYGFYLQDSYRALRFLTLEGGLREDFQVYPQPAVNPAFPLTGQYPNQFRRIAPRFGFALQPHTGTIIRGGFGQFYANLNGLNYRNAVVSNGLASQQSSVSLAADTTLGGNQQMLAFPAILPGDSSLFQASPDISLISPKFRAPYVLQGSLQVEEELSESTTLSVGTMWNHGVHLISSSAFDLNLAPLQGTTTYITCPSGTTAPPCDGPTVTLPTMDSGLLQEGYLDPNFGQINELISPGQNDYNSLFVQLKRRMEHGLMYQLSYTWAKTMVRDGVDFNNQFDLSNTHAASLLDQRHNLSVAAVYEPLSSWSRGSSFSHAMLGHWKLSTVMAFSSGRPFAALLSPAANGGNLNDTAFNEGTANSAAGISGAGPTPGIGLNSFYGPWLERIDGGIARGFSIGDRGELQIQAQAFNLLNHANYYVQNGNGVNPLQYNPIGAPGNDTCGDGVSQTQTCYLVPNAGAGNFGTLQEISPYGTPRALQFSARFSF